LVDGESALQAVQKTRPDLLITDINMPGVNGIALARQMIESDTPTEVILLTMYNDAEFVREGINRGVMGYLAQGWCLRINHQGHRVGHGQTILPRRGHPPPQGSDRR
jgi:DNA-binding NarL/FixJ family response regulator